LAAKHGEPAGFPVCRGNTALSMAGQYFLLAKMRPARGPRSVLCVVEVTIVGVLARVGMQPRRTSPRCAHVHREDGAHRVGDLAEAGEIDGARISAGAGDDHLGMVLVRQAFHPRRSRMRSSSLRTP